MKKATDSPENLDKKYKSFSHSIVINTTKKSKGKNAVTMKVTSTFKDNENEETFEETITAPTVEEAYSQLSEKINRIQGE